MKRFILSIALICITAHTALAAPGVTRNDGATSVINGTNLGGATIAVDDNGRAFASSTLEAGTANIGSVIGNTVTITNALAVTATAYEAADLVGVKNTVAGAVRTGIGSGKIQSVVIADKAAQAGNYDVIYFSADPSTTTFTDEAIFDPTDADLLMVVCSIPVTSVTTFNDNGLSASNNTGCSFEVPSGTSLYMAVVARSTPTFADAADVQVRTTIEQD